VSTIGDATDAILHLSTEDTHLGELGIDRDRVFVSHPLLCRQLPRNEVVATVLTTMGWHATLHVSSPAMPA
jgi:hypothetical protein